MNSYITYYKSNSKINELHFSCTFSFTSLIFIIQERTNKQYI